MSVEAQIFQSLKGFVSNRCYPNTFPQPASTPQWPAIRYTRVSTEVPQDLCGDSDDDETDIHIQIDVVAQTYGAAQTLRDQVMQALRDTDPPGIWQGQFDLYDAETKTHRFVMDFIFYQSSGGAGDSESPSD